MRNYTISPIGEIQSPYKEKFAVPRQPNLVAARSRLKLLGDANCAESIRGIEQFSHLWLLFLFDQNLAAGWKPTVRPPRLGGNERIGVFASRSTFRPNGVGMSVVKLKGISKESDGYYLELEGVDLVNGTPIIDIKPYVPYSDAIPDALAGYAQDCPTQTSVVFSDSALQQLTRYPEQHYFHRVIEQVLAQDPRPAYKKNQDDHREYAVNLFDFNVKFRVDAGKILVTTIEDF
jgi:tRNA-Thr(GGU) m(6)t(6)A37 methyltransferase TsaA